MTADIAPLTGRSRLTDVGRVMGSWSAGRASPARGGVLGMLEVKSRYQHQQTRAAAGREGCRVMDAARKNRRPGARAGEGVLEVVAGPDGGLGGEPWCGGCCEVYGSWLAF